MFAKLVDIFLRLLDIFKVLNNDSEIVEGTESLPILQIFSDLFLEFLNNFSGTVENPKCQASLEIFLYDF